MTELSKLQIRAKVLGVIAQIKSKSDYNAEFLSELISQLQTIEDKAALFDIFIKEYFKMSENECMLSSCLLKSLIEKEYIIEKSFEILQSSAYSDEAKYKIVQLLRVVDIKNANDVIPQYFDNPEEVIDMETRKLLDNAVYNPESMLDFLDFLYTIPYNDKIILLNSLKDDYSGDALANIVYPILYADFDDEIKLITIDILAESKSSVALSPIKYLLEITNNEKITLACNTALKKLKLSGANENKEAEYFKNTIKNMELADFYTTIPDGSGNQALFSSRVTSENKYTFFAVVVNDISGIVDSFGFFNISENEFVKIASRFFKSEGKYKVSAQYVKTKISNAFELSKKLKHTLPYEFICWSVIVNDISPLNKPLKDYIPKLNTDNISKDDVCNILTKEYTYRWFLTSANSQAVKELTENIYNLESYDIKEINNMLIKAKNEIFDENCVQLWKDRIVNLIYILCCNSKEDDAAKFAYLLENEEMFNIFESILIERSVFNHFVILKDNLKNNKLTVNIFRKKAVDENKYDENKLNNIIKTLESSWIDE